jgi:hypothetical protein
MTGLRDWCSDPEACMCRAVKAPGELEVSTTSSTTSGIKAREQLQGPKVSADALATVLLTGEARWKKRHNLRTGA